MAIKRITMGITKNRFDAGKLDVVIMGDTYGVKDQLKVLGAEWDGDSWVITIDKDIHAIGRANKLIKGIETDQLHVETVSRSQACAAVQ